MRKQKMNVNNSPFRLNQSPNIVEERALSIKLRKKVPLTFIYINSCLSNKTVYISASQYLQHKWITGDLVKMLQGVWIEARGPAFLTSSQKSDGPGLWTTISAARTFCCCSINKSSQALFHLMKSSTPDSPVLHCLVEFAQNHVHWFGDSIQPSHPLSTPSPPALSLSQHQGLFQWVDPSCQVAKVLELQLQHQSFQWPFRVDFL